MSLACTKHSYLVTEIEDLAPTLAEAFEVAKTGRPGPVIVDIAKDVQLAQAPTDLLPPYIAPAIDVAMNIASLGGHAHIVGLTGEDEPAKVLDRKSTRLNSSHANESRMPSSA